MEESRPLLNLLTQVRRRCLLVLALDQAMLGALAALGGAAALLLAGTQILDWYWPLILFLAGAGLGAVRSWRLRPSLYQVAQTVDRRMNLQDSLSTAWHFRAQAGTAGRRTLLWAIQQERADQTASGISPGEAFPWRAPRRWMSAVAMAVAVLALFGIRYGVSGSLDLRKPLLAGVPDFTASTRQIAMVKDKASRPPGAETMPPGVDAYTPPDPLDPSMEQTLSTVDIPDVGEESGESDRTGVRPDEIPDEYADQQGMESDDAADSGRRSNRGDGNASDPSERAQNAKTPPQSPSVQKPRDDSSLLNKMRDAMANLLAKLKIQPPAMTTSETGSSSEGQADPGRKEVASTPSGKQSQGDPKGKGMPTDDPDAEGEGEGEQQAQGAQTQGGQKGTQQASQSNQSGVGKQEGDKALRDARQEAAMGKLSEIFGRRAENLTGEVMMEVTSNKQQQLRTGYTQKSAAHRESGGEIHRDEVPLLYQHYVQQYFQEVRKKVPEEARPAAGAPQ